MRFIHFRQAHEIEKKMILRINRSLKARHNKNMDRKEKGSNIAKRIYLTDVGGGGGRVVRKEGNRVKIPTEHRGLKVISFVR